MGDFFLAGIVFAFIVYEVVMHFVFQNEYGNETLSAVVKRLQAKRWYVRVLVAAGILALFLHLVVELF